MKCYCLKQQYNNLIMLNYLKTYLYALRGNKQQYRKNFHSKHPLPFLALSDFQGLVPTPCGNCTFNSELPCITHFLSVNY